MTLLHTQDTYGSVVAVSKLNAACAPFANGTYPPKCYGGLGRRMSYINAVTQAAGTNVLLIDGGNFLTDSPLEAAGGPLALGEFYNTMGYSILKLGDHDVSDPAKLGEFLSAVPNATIVASNLVNSRNDSHLSSYTINNYAVHTFAGGERVGVCGGVSQSIRVKITTVTPLDSTNEVQALKAAVGRLTNLGVNKIIATIYDESLLSTVINEVVGIDVLIVHSELYITNPQVILNDEVFGTHPAIYNVPWGQPVLVVGAGSYGKYISQLDLVFDQYGVITSWGGDAHVLTSSYAESPAVSADVVDYYTNVVASLYTTQVGTAGTNISYESNCLYAECTIGNWQADKLREVTNTTMAFINSGSIGGGWEQGPIMAIDVQRVVKYGQDFVYTMTITGADLLVALENSVSKNNTGRFAQISGLKFSWNDQQDVGWRVVDAWIVDSDGNTELVNNNTRYSLSTLDFLAKGGDGYLVLSANGVDITNTGYTLNQVVLQNLATETVVPGVAPRVVSTTAVKRSCLAADGSMCNNNGLCIGGACQCRSGTGGEHCEPITSTDSSDNTTAIVLGIVLPLVFLLLIFAVIAALLMWGFMKYKQPKLVLKEPNYQVLVWRRESMESEKRSILPKKLNVKVSAVLEKFLMDKHVVKALSGVIHVKRAYIDEVSAALVLIHQSSNKGTKLIKTLLKHELSSEDEKVLFREETLGVKAFSVFSRMVGLPYLWGVFAYPIAELEMANTAQDEAVSPRLKSNVSDNDAIPLQSIFSITNTIEINPKNLEEGQDNSIGRLQLELILHKLLSRIIDSLPHFPLYMRQMCHMVYEDMRYDHPDYIHRVLGNLIFLRFICPALLVPQNYGLVKEHTHARTHRTLILIAKVLQNLANKNDFSGKEEFMESMNGFVQRNISKLETFFNALCAPAEEPKFGDPPTSIVPRQFKKKAMRVMYQFVQSHAKELNDELNEFPAYEVKSALEKLKYLTQEVDGLDDEDDDSEDSSTSDHDELDRADEAVLTPRPLEP